MSALPLAVTQLLFAVSAAMFVAYVAVALRPRLARDKSKLPPQPSRRRIVTNLVVGGAVMVWTGLSLVAHFSTS